MCKGYSLPRCELFAETIGPPDESRNMTTLIALTTYGLEIAEVGGTLAIHVAAGDTVHATVLFSRTETRPYITAAADQLGVASVEFQMASHGGLDGAEGAAVRDNLIATLRRTRPDIAIMPDPKHAMADLDPDRRPAGPLTLEALALAGRDFEVDRLGAPCEVPELYFYAPDHPTCVVDITDGMQAKLAALAELGYQAEFSEAHLRRRLGEDYDRIEALAGAGGGLLAALETAHAVHHGAGGHSRAALAEAFRHPGTITLRRLL